MKRIAADLGVSVTTISKVLRRNDDAARTHVLVGGADLIENQLGGTAADIALLDTIISSAARAS